MESNLFQVLRERGAKYPSNVFLRDPERSPLSYSECFRMSGQYAAALEKCGVKEGDRVLVKVEKSIDAVALYLACLQSGAVYVPSNPKNTVEETAYLFQDAEPSLVVFSHENSQSVDARSETLGRGHGSLTSLADSLQGTDEVTQRSGSDLAAMLYTSGTTGKPKGAMLTHRGLIANAIALHDIWGFESEDILLHCLPIFHVHGLFVALHCAMLSASEVIFLNKFDPESIISNMSEATVMMGVPTHYARLLGDSRFDHDLCAHMRLFTSGSAPMSELVHEKFQRQTSHRILERYGMTEAGIITSNPLEGERIPGTVGFPLPDMELRVAQDDRECDIDELGVVEVRGSHLFSGYWRQLEKTAAAFTKDGYLITGDIGSLDKHGRVSLQGRSNDMIISGGENIYPKEVELYLEEIPNVNECVVVGLPHPDLGEAVTAFLIPDGDFSEVAVGEYFKSRIASYKQPKKYVLVDSLPRNAMGKIQRSKLRDEYSTLFFDADNHI
ncbi:MAG: AMP-binding protein [Acidimicrobiales bacterium]|nr:AMP-binding protein [Acidimicrobiales bacterium]